MMRRSRRSKSNNKCEDSDYERVPSSLFVDVDRLEADGVRVVAPDGVDFAAVHDVLGEVLAKLECVAHAPEDCVHPEKG